jgi:hypothetical protein
MDMGTKAKPIPDVLQWRDEDPALGLPDIRGSEIGDRAIAWDCEHFVGQLRPAKWGSVTKTGDDDDMILHWQNKAPSAEARARADEIIAAFDKWKKERKPRGFKKAKRECDKAYTSYKQIEDEIADTPATTFQGMLAKIRCAKAYDKSEKVRGFDSGSCGEAMAFSIFEDIEQLTKQP